MVREGLRLLKEHDEVHLKWREPTTMAPAPTLTAALVTTPDSRGRAITVLGTGLSLSDIARGTGLSLSDISLVMRGRRRPSSDAQNAIAGYLGVSVDTLYRRLAEARAIYRGEREAGRRAGRRQVERGWLQATSGELVDGPKAMAAIKASLRSRPKKRA